MRGEAGVGGLVMWDIEVWLGLRGFLWAFAWEYIPFLLLFFLLYMAFILRRCCMIVMIPLRGSFSRRYCWVGPFG